MDKQMSDVVSVMNKYDKEAKLVHTYEPYRIYTSKAKKVAKRIAKSIIGLGYTSVKIEDAGSDWVIVFQ